MSAVLAEAAGVRVDRGILVNERLGTSVLGIFAADDIAGLRNLSAAKRFLRKVLKRHGRPEMIVIDGSQTNRKAILSCDAESRLQDRSRRRLKPIRIRQSQYLNNRIEQDHRAVKRRVQPMLGIKSTASAREVLCGIEMVHIMRKRQAKYACAPQPRLAEQFELLAV